MNSQYNYITLSNVTKTYNGNSRSSVALNDISLSIEKSEFIVIVGKSGSGKSTLMNILSGIDYPSSGTVKNGDIFISKLTSTQLALWRGKNVGIVFQFFQLMPTLTIIENVMLPMEFANFNPPGGRKKRALELLGSVGLSDLANRFPNSISGGEKQRAAIARALANDPPLILADEPTGNLDSANAKIIYNLFNTLSQKGKTIFYITHDMEIKLDYTRIITLSDGQVSLISPNNNSLIKPEVR